MLLPERIDCHTHTVFSGHGKGSVAEVVDAAAELGITTLALTEHLTLSEDIDPDYGESMSPSEATGYRDDVAAVRSEHPEIEVLYGTEIDWLGEADPYVEKMAEAYEYRLGSVHLLDGWAFDNPKYIDEWHNRDVNEVWRRYFEVWCQATLSDYPFSCMAHPDLPKKLGFRPSIDMRELYDAAANAAARKGVMVEVNTSGLRNRAKELYPCNELLRAFHDAGVDCTIGSDAHDPSLVGYGFEEACAAMLQAGYSRISVPRRDGDRRYVSLKG